MIPDFNKNTVDTLAKRSAYKCSNPDCRINTIGPCSDPAKSTKIGEAAHIYGARLGSKRFISKMTDSTRAEITNSIWLCRNCHKIIDNDEEKYSANVLFAWREKHEEFISSTLGNNTDQISYNEQISILKDFDHYTPIIKRIIVDKPDGWEYRVTAELMRFFNEPIFRKLKDLKEGLYLKPIENVDADKAYNWIQDRLHELSVILTPVNGLLERLTNSWGKPGEAGDLKEIHHVTKLIKEYLEHVIIFEERIQFAYVPKDYERAVYLLKNLVGSQIEKLSSIPSDLDEITSFLSRSDKKSETCTEIRKEFVFELPVNWQKEFNRELNKFNTNNKNGTNNSSGCLTFAIIIMAGIFLFLLM